MKRFLQRILQEIMKKKRPCDPAYYIEDCRILEIFDPPKSFAELKLTKHAPSTLLSTYYVVCTITSRLHTTIHDFSRDFLNNRSM